MGRYDIDSATAPTTDPDEALARLLWLVGYERGNGDGSAAEDICNAVEQLAGLAAAGWLPQSWRAAAKSREATS